MEFVTVSLIKHSEKEKEVYTYSLSDSTGKVIFSRIPYGKYSIKAQFAGYKTKETAKFNLEDDYFSHERKIRTNIYDAGELLLKEEINLLSGITVTERYTLIYTFVDNFTLSIIANDILNQNRSINRYRTESYVYKSISNVVGRYFMLNISYKFYMGKQKSKRFKDKTNSILRSNEFNIGEVLEGCKL